MKNSSYKHGYSTRKNRNPLYKIWGYMKSRCYNLNDTCFENYGKRGIIVCDEWKNNPVMFINWAINNGWSKNLLLDRINNDGNYEPSNCRFIDHSLSCINQRMRKDNKSGYRGVTFSKRYNHWIARVQTNKKRIELCWVKSAKEAALIRDKYITENHLPHPLSFPELTLINI